MMTTALCDKRPAYLLTTLKDKEGVLNNTLEDIRDLLDKSANFVIRTSGIFKYDDLGLPEILFPGTCRIKELDSLTFQINFGSGTRANYETNSGRIFLRQGIWCKSSLIHETLHGLSIFASEVDAGLQYDFINEGITELLTGYILWKKHPYCFESWRTKKYPKWCAPSRDYNKMARIWYTFCRFVDFDIVKKLYFRNSKKNWDFVWNRFIAEINSEGIKFKSPLKGNNSQLQDRFLRECKASFGKGEVERIFETESFNFEYDLI